ncbi:uncharacterized protein LOC123503923 isoform X2 [Portunus trituberculatus]|uniref:uncharacterized protein LOC123503923 isoform X2 n=1 Tax=Portunus trituberculatus TaxID=210409 RepID=UPI001E1D0C84|nr:uncharacterized protein LOC123503923 isoform X2 [Portunus trituberculatus]
MMWSRTALWLAIMRMVLSNPVNDLKKCNFSYDNSSNPPFLVDTKRKELIYPDIVHGKQQSVTLNNGTTVLASCPGTDNQLVNYSKSSMEITCRDSKLFNDSDPVSWEDLGCSSKVKPTLKSGRSCGKDSRMYYIRWDIRRNLYLCQISVCFNTKLKTTVFVSHTIHGRFIGAKTKFKNNTRFFSKNLIYYYNQEKQKKILNSSNEVFGYFLSKGHLAPVADFVLEAEKRATYHYINIVPQWKTINNGNWEKLESAVRKLAKDGAATLDVYTGTHGILELLNMSNCSIKIFLNNKNLPVPALMWKVIHNPANQTAVAIVMVNDVTNSSDFWSARYSTHSENCSKLGWVNWQVNNVIAVDEWGRGRTRRGIKGWHSLDLGGVWTRGGERRLAIGQG